MAARGTGLPDKVARGRVFVATDTGHVYMLQPSADTAPIVPEICTNAPIVPAIFATDTLTITTEFGATTIEGD